MAEPNTTRRVRHWWREYRGTLTFLLLMLVFRSAWADWVTVPTGSMNPTIIEGDRVLVDKHVYGVRVPWTLIRLSQGRDPERGEIVVFDSPLDGTSLVKRVVGIPGDVVALDEHGLSINGVHAQYSPGERRQISNLLSATQAWHPAIWRETGVLPAHDVLRLGLRRPDPLQSFGPIRVPEASYLMLGDSRDNSADSRVFGFVPRRNIVGRASRVAFSCNPEHFYLPRGDRFLAPLM